MPVLKLAIGGEEFTIYASPTVHATFRGRTDGHVEDEWLENGLTVRDGGARELASRLSEASGRMVELELLESLTVPIPLAIRMRLLQDAVVDVMCWEEMVEQAKRLVLDILGGGSWVRVSSMGSMAD